MADDTYYFGFMFYRVDPKWRWIADMGKSESAKETEQAIKLSGVRYRAYSTQGIRAESDFLLWVGAKSVTDLQKVPVRLHSTVFGKYIEPSRTYLSCTRPSVYSSNNSPLSFLTDTTPKKYAVVYPFTKTRDWYLLPAESRQHMMNEHITVSKRHPDIILNTTYSFGLDDQDFMLAFETDDLSDFQNLIMDLRATTISKYVVSDTPMMVCVRQDIIPLIESLG
ncbi:MAG: chlorite dismutase family protein [Cenarchaeum sp. SB0665_bin_23]|nr:chlorite dismutase family protein [Cenarchaeum sp. SB0667_bin_13]MXY37555.1 chlorite dismutase family protein [Cenarchaeum sp. SB0664_bin_35]MXY61087.1 chlorite dismutase family protein [Cenarchaeum sp. SB0665_bin_23]MXZ93200.1 chlorite dismutase family protein [Cenarchaeum sp. SB0666_bin_15]MYB46231.1 chlorite dismutase family protein [Cenarchaeum sp. SB0662_bin_33]MYC80143.1 chlorite dismutase family protein [Cenarchaeum sp. SB0661_bin_35]MYD58116.1 chlorite dismutase family protein [Cen